MKKSSATHLVHLGNGLCPKCGRLGSLRLHGSRASHITYYEVDHYGVDGNSRGHDRFNSTCYIGKRCRLRNKLKDLAKARERLARRKALEVTPTQSV